MNERRRWLQWAEVIAAGVAAVAFAVYYAFTPAG